MEYVECGLRKRHLKIPDGYEKLNEDVIVTKEMASCCKVANVRFIYWMDIDEDDIGMSAGAIADHIIIKSLYVNTAFSRR